MYVRRANTFFEVCKGQCFASCLLQTRQCGFLHRCLLCLTYLPPTNDLRPVPCTAGTTPARVPSDRLTRMASVQRESSPPDTLQWAPLKGLRGKDNNLLVKVLGSIPTTCWLRGLTKSNVTVLSLFFSFVEIKIKELKFQACYRCESCPGGISWNPSFSCLSCVVSYK